MEQDEDADADSGRRTRGDLGVCADGAGAGEKEVGEWRVANSEWRTPPDVVCDLPHSLFATRHSPFNDGKLKRCDVPALARLRHCPHYPQHSAAGTADEFTEIAVRAFPVVAPRHGASG